MEQDQRSEFDEFFEDSSIVNKNKIQQKENMFWWS